MKASENSTAERSQPGKSARVLRVFLMPALIVLASVVVRLATLKNWGMGAIDLDPAGYTRIAENLRNGIGYVGIMSSGLELNTPPLLPVLISAASFVTGNYVWAGRLIALIMGAFLPLPVFGIASRLFNRRTALVAAALTILYPLEVSLSLAAWGEGPYATLLLCAVYVVLCALDSPSIRLWCGVGGAFGLTYLLRPEAFAQFLIVLLIAFTVTDDGLAIRSKRAIAAIAVFGIVALPEVIFLYKSTGKVMLDAKSAIALAVDVRILRARADIGGSPKSADSQYDEPSPLPNLESWQPWQDKWATNAISTNLEGTGIWMRTNNEVIRDSHITVNEFARILGKSIRHNIPAFVRILSSRWLGSPFLLPLAMLGAVRRPWRQPSASRRLLVIMIPTMNILTTFAILWVFPRFYFVLVPFLLIWAANGLVEVHRWTKASISASNWPWLSTNTLACAMPTLIALIAVVYPVRGVRDLDEFKQNSSAAMAEQVGLWIEQQQGRPIKIMGPISTAFYAHAQLVPFPYCRTDLALRFLDATKIDYVVLHRGERFTRYYEDWLTKGIKDPRAELVYVSSGANAGEFKVYRWHQADKPE
jgi:4-amino-4-deoxy-L-arabinose transferase-like glycosyltransferase